MLTLVLFLTFLDNTIVSVALGSVQAELQAGVSELQWVVSAYALTFAGAMLAFGMVGDEFGRKRVMLIGVGIFCAGSVLAALAPNIGLVIAGRAVMGLGAAASEPGTLSMLRHLYTEERSRTRAVGSGRRCPGWPWRSARSSAAPWSARGTGAGSSGSTWPSALVALVAGLSCCRRTPIRTRTGWTSPATVLGAAALAALIFG